MLKCISHAGQFGDELTSQLVKVAGRRLRGEDRRRLEKRASGTLLHELESAMQKLADGEALIHLLAIGSTERYGANRNGDGFRKKACQQYHPTFVKYARFYRNHANRDPSKSYGRVIASGWNPEMDRIELFVGLNETEKAAKANGGLVADRELEKLAAGKELADSMACFVPFDVCSWCRNKAKTREDYCRGEQYGGHCKAGGLYHNIGRLVEVDGGVHHLHADNTEPRFFDISSVDLPADRIAYVTGLLSKQAAAFGKQGSSLLYGMTPPADVVMEPTDQLYHLVKLAKDLADIETRIESETAPAEAGLSASIGVCDETAIAVCRNKMAAAMTSLGRRGIILSPEAFSQLLGISPAAAEKTGAAIRSASPGIYSRLLCDGTLPKYLTQVYTAAAPDTETEKAAQSMVNSQSVFPRWRMRRSATAAVRGWQPPTVNMKTASAVSQDVQELAAHYAAYKLAAVETAVSLGADFALTADSAVRQNYSH